MSFLSNSLLLVLYNFSSLFIFDKSNSNVTVNCEISFNPYIFLHRVGNLEVAGIRNALLFIFPLIHFIPRSFLSGSLYFSC